MYVAMSEPGGGDIKLLTMYLSSSGCVVVRWGIHLFLTFLVEEISSCLLESFRYFGLSSCMLVCLVDV